MQGPQLLTEGSIVTALFRLGLPILCASVLQGLNSLVSTIWVGRYLGEAALAAVSNAQSVMFLLTGASFGVAGAATLLVGECLGAHDVTGAKRLISTGLAFFASISVAMALAGLILGEPMLVLMKTPAESLPLALVYVRVLFLALPTMNMYTFVTSVLLGAGDSNTPLNFLLLSVAIGLVLNPAFIFGLGSIPGAGIAGSALATLVAQSVSLAALVVHLYRRRHPLCLCKNEMSSLLRVNWSIVRALIRNGIPMGAQVFVVYLSAVLMFVLVNRFGVDTTAAFGASIQLWTYVQMPAVAVAVAASTIAAQNVGAQKWDRVKAVTRVGVVYSSLLTSSVVLVVYAIDVDVYRLFLPAGSPALHIAIHASRVVTWSFVFLSISLVLLGVMRATGAGMVPLFVYTFSLLIVRLPLAALLMGRWQVDAIWWSFPVSFVLVLVLAALCYRYVGAQRTRRTLSDRMGIVCVPSAESPWTGRAQDSIRGESDSRD